MKYVWLFVAAVLIHAPAVASVDEVEGLAAAVVEHETALKARDPDRLAATVLFPHVQFYPDGRVVVMADQSDFREADDEQLAWRVTGTSLVSHEGNQAIVRATFESTGANAGNDLGAGLWCFTLVDGEWLVNWRHYLGVAAAN